MRNPQSREHLRFSTAADRRREQAEARTRVADLRLAASGMRYFGDYTEADALEREAAREEGRC